MQDIALVLHRNKQTKNKVIYGTGDGSVIQSLYIEKDALGEVPPARLRIVISEESAQS